MKKKDFLELGLTDEGADVAVRAFSEAVKGFVPKSRLDEVITQRNHYEAESKRIDTELTEMKKVAKDQDELSLKITELQTNIEKTNSKHKAEVKQIKIENAIKELGAKRTKSVLSEIDTDKVKVDEDGNLIGLNEQITLLKENEETSFLFESEKKLKLKGAEPGGSESKDSDEIDFKTASYVEIAAHLADGGELPE